MRQARVKQGHGGSLPRRDHFGETQDYLFTWSSGKSGVLVPFGDVDALARAGESLIQHPAQRRALGAVAQMRPRKRFSANVIVPRYEALYGRVCAQR